MAVITGLLLAQFLGTFFAIIVGACIYFRYFLFNYWKKKGVCYVEPTIPFGNIGSTLMGKISMGELYANAYAKQKSNCYFGMYHIHKPSLVIADPDLIRYVLTKKFNNFHDRGMYCNPKVDPLSSHLFLLSGTKWRNLRAKLTPTFTSGKMKQIFGTIKTGGDHLTEYLKPKAENREIVDIKELVARYSTNIAMSTAYGLTCNILNDPNNEFRYWGRKNFEPRCVVNTLSVFAPWIMDLFSIPFIDVEVSTFFTKAFYDNVKYREANNISKPDFMNLIMQLIRTGNVDEDDDGERPRTKEATVEKLDMLEGAAQAFVFFVAGYETASSAVNFALYELAHNQDIQGKVMTEIDAVLEKFGDLTYDGLQEMTYLHKVVSETLRKYPSFPVLNRVCTESITLPSTELRVKKGINVVIPVLGIHRDPEIYPEPDKFDPERFSRDNIAARHPYAYLPFGEGPRICIAMRFGSIVTKVGLVSVLSKYRVRLGPKIRVPLELDPGCIFVAPKDPIELLIEVR